MSITRRELLQVGAATAAGVAAQQRLTQAELLQFENYGNITLLHMADLHGQLMPVTLREPSQNIGVGDVKGQPPHVTGADFLKRFGIAPDF